VTLPPGADGGRPRLLYVVTEDWFFLSHRLPMAHAAQAAGFEVHVATSPDLARWTWRARLDGFQRDCLVV